MPSADSAMQHPYQMEGGFESHRVKRNLTTALGFAVIALFAVVCVYQAGPARAAVEDKSQALCLRMAQTRKYPWSQQQQPP